jgi:hypothetical protein
MITCDSCQEARCVCRRAVYKGCQNPPLVGLKKSKQEAFAELQHPHAFNQVWTQPLDTVATAALLLLWAGKHWDSQGPNLKCCTPLEILTL